MAKKIFVSGAFLGALLAGACPAAAAPEVLRSESGLEMVLVPGGPVDRAAPGGDGHRVRVDAFYIGRHPVTQAQFQMVMGSNPSRWQADDHPVERVTWVGAAKFCNRLSAREGLRPVYDPDTWKADFSADGYRLPTEAEWERAAGAGTATRYFFGDDPARLRFFAWTRENAAGRTRPVGRKMPNPLGLHDIYGNVWEWCHDYYQDDYYLSALAVNPRGPAGGGEKVVRGGSWDSPAEESTTFFRGRADPAYSDICTAAYDVYGFRVARNAP